MNISKLQIVSNEANSVLRIYRLQSGIQFASFDKFSIGEKLASSCVEKLVQIIRPEKSDKKKVSKENA